jgi:hypothetical protein
MDAFGPLLSNDSLMDEDKHLQTLDLVDASGHPGLRHYANRLLYSRHYRAFYLFLAAGSLCALVMLIYNRWYLHIHTAI